MTDHILSKYVFRSDFEPRHGEAGKIIIYELPDEPVVVLAGTATCRFQRFIDEHGEEEILREIHSCRDWEKVRDISLPYFSPTFDQLVCQYRQIKRPSSYVLGGSRFAMKDRHMLVTDLDSYGLIHPDIVQRCVKPLGIVVISDREGRLGCMSVPSADEYLRTVERHLTRPHKSDWL